jgi:hypothetical protein
VQGVPGTTQPRSDPDNYQDAAAEERILAADSRLRANCSSVSGARHGLVAKRNGQVGQPVATHSLTSCDEPAQQSRHFARIALSGDIGECPAARYSSGVTFRGSRPTR